MTVAFLEFEGVLIREDGSPIPLGMMLLRMLRGGYRIALSTSKDDPARIERWLLENGFHKDTVAYRQYVSPLEEGMSEDEVFLAHLDAVLFHAPVELVVTAAPRRAAMCMEQRSITALLFCSPITARPENRPGMRNWEEIENEVSRRRILRTKASVGEDDNAWDS